DDGPDSFDLSRALLGKDREGRDHLVEQAGALSLIEGDWKYIEPGDGPKISAYTAIELGFDPEPQLYDLAKDIGEKHNLAADHPDVVRSLAARLAKIRSDGRSRR
ncbi:MAG: arylsulfatase, partial [Candidatus Aminicenantes bacterium]|nr:arylsulfatase [Candidatus Aminicenantes bacterium]